MASSIEFVEYVIEQLRGVGELRYKRMFGEFGIYCDDIYYACICDNRFLVKITKEGQELLKEWKEDFPYAGAKPMFLIEDIDDRSLLHALTQTTCLALQNTKKKR